MPAPMALRAGGDWSLRPGARGRVGGGVEKLQGVQGWIRRRWGRRARHGRAGSFGAQRRRGSPTTTGMAGGAGDESRRRDVVLRFHVSATIRVVEVEGPLASKSSAGRLIVGQGGRAVGDQVGGRFELLLSVVRRVAGHPPGDCVRTSCTASAFRRTVRPVTGSARLHTPYWPVDVRGGDSSRVPAGQVALAALNGMPASGSAP